MGLFISRDEDKQTLYRRLGYGGDLHSYDKVLEQAGLTRVGKPRISLEKQEQISALLSERFLLVCGRGDCRARAKADVGKREISRAAMSVNCEVCSGGASQAAVDEVVSAWRKVGWTRPCIVGGSPNTRHELKALIAKRLQLHLVDDEKARTRKAADSDIAWANREVIWGGTQLGHKTSNLYTGNKVLQINGRGIRHLARETVAASGRHLG